MPRYIVTLTDEEISEVKEQVQRGGKGYRIKHAQILLKLDKRPENKEWTYDRIKEAYGASHSTIAGVAKRFVQEGLEAALGRKEQENRCRKVTGEVEAKICTIACSDPPKGTSRWTMQAIADEVIRLKVLDYITDTTICEVMKKTKSSHGRSKNGVYPKRTGNMQQKWKTYWKSISVLMTRSTQWSAWMRRINS